LCCGKEKGERFLEITVRLDRFLFLFLVAVSPFFFVMMRRVFAVYPCCAIFAGSALRVEGKYQLGEISPTKGDL